ncbi:MarR family transcriptional regulator [Desulfovibrio aminophilus]|nr:MarR family transcriptional regulator [Desulfovibrio aminophilus]MCM0756070.1 MarR family transcriptional regulator [Desulfovibrio aminophilus]
MSKESDDHPGELLALAARLWAQSLAARLADLGLAPGQVPVLRRLRGRDGLTQAELCLQVGVEQPTMANTLKRMARDGLIRRAADPGDRRRTLLRLSSRARGLLEGLDLALADVERTAFRDFSDQEREILARLMSALCGNLRADRAEDVLVLLDVVAEEGEAGTPASDA